MKIKIAILFVFFPVISLLAKPPLVDSLSSNFYLQKAETFYQNQQYEEACQQFIKANEVSNSLKLKQINYTLLIFALVDIIGLFMFLYLEKQRSYKKLVSKNIQWAKQIDFKALDETERQNITKFVKLFDEERIYTNKDLTINDLAIKLCVSKATVSKLSNSYFSKTVPALINEYRIKEAVNLLTDATTSNYKIEAISDMCGFNTRQVFHAVFKKETGLTPVQFQKMALNKDFSD